MLMAELSRRSGVPVATIKYYLREGLLPPGEATSATRADYGEHHLHRLRLIRALLEVGEVPLAGIGRILAAVDDESVSLHEVLGAVQYALGPHLAPPAGDGPSYVTALEFDVQARVKGGGEYQPLVDVHGVPSWPARPDFQQLVNGPVLAREDRPFEAVWETRRVAKKTLHVTRDFDYVVLGVSVGALPAVAHQLIEREPRWREMVEHVKTVPTQAFQIWMRADIHELGWRHAPVNLSGFVEPFDTWADMSHLVPEETWKGSVRTIAYFCSVLPDAAGTGAVTDRFHSEQRERVRGNAVRFLDRDIRALWPRSACGDRFRWDLLTSGVRVKTGTPGADERRFDTQYWTANVNPTDRYVLSLPGSIAYRMSPLDMTFDNLTIAGDWTASGLDSGCIESAVMSGLLAAHAISQRPALEDIVGYDHP